MKFLDLMILKGEGYVEWAMRINELSDLADLDSIQSQDLKLMKYCQGLKPEDKLHNLVMEMKPKSWARAQEIIRKYAQNMALNADLVKARPKGQGHMNSMSGGLRNQTPRSLSLSPGKQRKKYDTNTRGREQGRGGEARSSGRSSRDPSNSRVCWNCNEVTNDHFGNTCPKPQKKRDDPNRSVTPYPRGRSASKERGGATQGSETYRLLKGFYGNEPLSTVKGQPELEASPTKKDESEEDDMTEEGEEGTENEKKSTNG